MVTQPKSIATVVVVFPTPNPPAMTILTGIGAAVRVGRVLCSSDFTDIQPAGGAGHDVRQRPLGGDGWR